MSEFQKFLDQALKNVELNPIEETPIYETYDIYEEIKRQIIKARTDLGITQTELATRAGLTQANISKIEKGLSHPTVDTLLKLAHALNKRLVIRIDELEVVNSYD